jgi:simple sugar transport system permease protein
MLNGILKNVLGMAAVAPADAVTLRPLPPQRRAERKHGLARLPLPRLEPRAEPSRVMRYCSPLLAVLLTLIGGMIVFFALGKDPIAGFQVFFLNPLKDTYSISELLLKATPLMLIAVGLAVGFRANVWNIGAEGQYVVGAIFGGGLALYFHGVESPLVLPAMVIAGAVGGALWAAIAAFLRTRFNANEILVSLMFVYIAQLVVSWLVHGPWKDPEGFNFPQTRMFHDAAVLPLLIEGTRLNAALPLAIAVLIAGYLFMNRSFLGFQMQVAGQAEAAARYAGFSAKRTIWIGLLSGGALAGVAGMTEVAGPMGQITEHVSNNYGFAAIIVAFVGRLNALGIFLASLLMALLYLGGEQAQQYLALPSSISKVFQGMLLFFLLGADIFVNYRLRFGAAAKSARK